jgi:DNA adenine methylase
MFCIDPPYFNKGSSLYTSFYRAEDHADLAEVILRLQRPWVVTYDNAPEINALYDSQSRYSFDVNYSVQTKRTAAELLVTSEGLALPFALDDRRIA